MEACDYPDLEKHRIVHQQLAAKASDLANQWRKNRDPELFNHIRRFLRVWLFDHIVKADTEIRPYAKGKGQDIQKALESIESARAKME